jgi:multidrug efflux pump subunit AcrA (membrane-fusion protein)
MKQARAALAKKVEEYQAAVAQGRKSVSGSSRRLSEWNRDVTDPKKGSPGIPATPGDIRAAAIELQRQEIARLETERRLHEVRAPFDGRIGEVLMQAGDLSAQPEAPVVTLVEERMTTAIAYLAPGDAHKVRVGDIARLVPRDLSGPALTGRVTALAPNISEIPIRFRHNPNLHEFGRNVYIRLDAPAPLPGQAFQASFRRGSGGGA